MQKETGKSLVTAMVAAFGGVPGLTEAIRVAAEEPTLTEHAVRKWPYRGVPHKWRAVVARVARRRDIEVPKGFGG